MLRAGFPEESNGYSKSTGSAQFQNKASAWTGGESPRDSFGSQQVRSPSYRAFFWRDSSGDSSGAVLATSTFTRASGCSLVRVPGSGKSARTVAAEIALFAYSYFPRPAAPQTATAHTGRLRTATLRGPQPLATALRTTGCWVTVRISHTECLQPVLFPDPDSLECPLPSLARLCFIPDKSRSRRPSAVAARTGAQQPRVVPTHRAGGIPVLL